MPETVVVLDTNQVQSDWLLKGLAVRVLRFLSWHDYLKVVIPPVVVEELVANHERGKVAAERNLQALNRDRSRAGLPLVRAAEDPVEYRTFLDNFLADTVSWEIAGWPSVSHAEIVGWSLLQRAPFDEKDRGYRDSLIWTTVKELAAAGHAVAFATRDRDFDNGTPGELATHLAGEVASLRGSVTLVPDLSSWLVDRFPGQATSLKHAIDIARDINVDDFLMESEFLYSLNPDLAELDLPVEAVDPAVYTLDWNGPLQRVGVRKGVDGATFASYDMPVAVEVRASLPSESVTRLGWEILQAQAGSSVLAEATFQMAARLVVFDDGDGVIMDSVSFRPVTQRDPMQLELFDE
jgi:hypothetical protein